MDGFDTDEQVLSVSNLERFNNAIALEDEKNVQEIIHRLTDQITIPTLLANMNDPRKLTDDEKAGLPSIDPAPMMDQLPATSNISPSGTINPSSKQVSKTSPSKIVIPNRIVNKVAHDNDSSDSDEDYHGTSESSGERSTKSVSVKSEDESESASSRDFDEENLHHDEVADTADEGVCSSNNCDDDDDDDDDACAKNSDTSCSINSSNNNANNNSVSTINHRNNEVIKTTMNNLNSKISNRSRNANNKNTNTIRSTNRGTINTTTPNTNNININNTLDNKTNNIIHENQNRTDDDVDSPKKDVQPFDIEAARILNQDKSGDFITDGFNDDPFNINSTTSTTIVDPDNTNKGIGSSTNTTNNQDDNSRYFTIIHDVPREGRCKKCPKMHFGSIKEWWKVQQNLAPRTRHSLRIGLVVVGSALLLLVIFLLARLPHAPKDVTHPAMYDLPADDSFRPRQPAFHQSAALQDYQDLPPLPQVDHPDVVGGLNVMQMNDPIPVPGADVNLEALARRKGVGYHPLLGVPVDETFLQMEVDRKNRLAQMTASVNKTGAVESILDIVRQTVEAERKEMQDKEKNLWDSGETPLRILLVSTWRSGSTFLGQVLQQHPGVFQHYEPFSYMGVRQIRSGSDAFQSQQVLHRLMECRFKGQDEYLNYSFKNPIDMSGHNKRVWNACNGARRVDVCSNATFLTEACNMFPIQLVKTVRLRLNLTQLFLGETRLNAKVVFLVRDPRATMSSRRSSVGWCQSSPDCSSPEVLCSDLKEDLKVSAALERLYPSSFTMVRYEDLANDPQNVVKKLLNFLGMEFSSELSKFVAEHTESEVEKPWSIARKSAARVSRWKEQLPKEEIDDIQKACKPVIERLGYEMLDRK